MNIRELLYEFSCGNVELVDIQKTIIDGEFFLNDAMLLIISIPHIYVDTCSPRFAGPNIFFGFKLNLGKFWLELFSHHA